MLEKTDYANIFKKLLAVYGDKSEKSHGKIETFKIYYEFLLDFSKEEFENGVNLLIKEEKNPFFPTISVIIQYIEKAKNMGMDNDLVKDLKMVQKLTGRNFSSNKLNLILREKEEGDKYVLAN